MIYILSKISFKYFSQTIIYKRDNSHDIGNKKLNKAILDIIRCNCVKMGRAIKLRLIWVFCYFSYFLTLPASLTSFRNNSSVIIRSGINDSWFRLCFMTFLLNDSNRYQETMLCLSYMFKNWSLLKFFLCECNQWYQCLFLSFNL